LCTQVADQLRRTGSNARLDERDPCTTDRIGSILKHVPTDARIAARYAYYM
jgi:hypothetical protein